MHACCYPNIQFQVTEIDNKNKLVGDEVINRLVDYSFVRDKQVNLDGKKNLFEFIKAFNFTQ